MQMTATFPTDRGGSLMATMAKHFAHKVAVDLTPAEARVSFPDGLGIIALGEGGLHLTIRAPGPRKAEDTRRVLEDHLMRFARRDGPQPLVWNTGADPA